jgi:tRNA threonylcarbamoyl adenosine modification protein (Sua5/YciO/YrdC/YwlC family)
MSVVPVPIDDPGLWERVRAVLARNECVVLPTDTVYGIGANPADATAVARLQAAKGRSDAFPPPVLVADAATAWTLVDPPSAAARRLAAAFWPGPLTLILTTTRRDLSLAGVTGTLGLRVPGHDRLRAVLRASGPLAVSSANRHNQPPAVTIGEAIDQLGDAVGLYIDGGPTPGPAASTVVDCTGGELRLLREGLIPAHLIHVTAEPASA